MTRLNRQLRDAAQQFVRDVDAVHRAGADPDYMAALALMHARQLQQALVDDLNDLNPPGDTR